jgi:hypothetical protein
MNIAIGSAAFLNTYRSRLVVNDSFNRADNATSLTKTDNGLTWAPINGTWGISGNKCIPVSKNHNDIVSVDSTNKPAIFYCDFTGALSNSSNFSVPSLLLKFIDASNFIQVTFLPPTTLVLGKKDNDAFSNLSVIGISLQDNVVYKMKVEITQEKIKVYVNDAQMIDYTLSDTDKTKFLAATKSGLRLQRGGTPTTEATIDNLIIDEMK